MNSDIILNSIGYKSQLAQLCHPNIYTILGYLKVECLGNPIYLKQYNGTRLVESCFKTKVQSKIKPKGPVETLGNVVAAETAPLSDFSPHDQSVNPLLPPAPGQSSWS